MSLLFSTVNGTACILSAFVTVAGWKRPACIMHRPECLELGRLRGTVCSVSFRVKGLGFVSDVCELRALGFRV